MREFHVVIPARYASTRLPGKPLADIAGKPMIEHVYERALESGANDVTVATDDQRIADAVTAFGGNFCMTAADHESGTDRIAEVVSQMGWGDDELVVNLQGDEPLMPPVLLKQVAQALANQKSAVMSTLAVPLTDAHQVLDPNVVKVVCDAQGLALYFSRATIPWNRDVFSQGSPANDNWAKGLLRHLGIYAYRVSFLKRYVTWEVSPLEAVESLEQLRVLWYGEKISVAVADEAPHPGVDSMEDLELVRSSFS